MSARSCACPSAESPNRLWESLFRADACDPVRHNPNVVIGESPSLSFHLGTGESVDPDGDGCHAKRGTGCSVAEIASPTAWFSTAEWTRSVVEQQSAHISAEWQLLLGCLLCRRSGSGSHLGVAWALLHADVGS